MLSVHASAAYARTAGSCVLRPVLQKNVRNGFVQSEADWAAWPPGGPVGPPSSTLRQILKRLILQTGEGYGERARGTRDKVTKRRKGKEEAERGKEPKYPKLGRNGLIWIFVTVCYSAP